jgi:flagellar motor component MotA
LIDGADLERSRSFLETEIYVFEEKAKPTLHVLKSSPATHRPYGMIGTIMVSFRPGQYGVARTDGQRHRRRLITTLYGEVIANLLCLPTANSSGPG